LEISKSVDQKREATLRFLSDHAEFLSQQGSVQASWRHYNEHALGPFFRLQYRAAGRQRCLYLGGDRTLASEVQAILREMQAPLRAKRTLAQQTATARKALKNQTRNLDKELRKRGLYLKGTEVRGWRGLHSLALP
jgi:hypothetical protein